MTDSTTVVLMSDHTPFDFSVFAEKWSSPIVARSKITEFTGGAYTSGYMANLDSSGDGPPHFFLGKKVCYPIDLLIDWLATRAKVN